MLLLGEIIKNQAIRYPNKTAIVFKDIRWSYKDLNERINQIANSLIKMGIKKGDCIAVLDKNSADYVATYYAIAKIGAIICPVNYWFRSNEVAYVVDNSDATVMIIGKEFTSIANEVKTIVGEGVTFIYKDESYPKEYGIIWDELLEDSLIVEPEVSVSENDPHIIMYTSGTTGKPKGVVHSQRAHYLDGIHTALTFGIGFNDSFIVYTPMFHVGAWDHLKLFLITGGKVVVKDKFDAGDILQSILEENITFLTGVPATLKMILEHESFSEKKIESLRNIYFGGSVPPKLLLKEIIEKLKEKEIWHAYGLTESGPWTALLRPEDQIRKLGSIGKPVIGVEIQIVDDSGAPVPPYRRGEIVVKSKSIMKEYWKLPEKTQETIKNGWLHTGDVGMIDDEGYIFIVDRKKDMIISGGENIYPAEIEELLYSHPKVHETAVIGIPDEDFEEKVLAIIKPVNGQLISEEEIKTFVRQNLAGFKTPKVVEFIDEFPKTAFGKIAKGDLRKKYGSVFQQ